MSKNQLITPIQRNNSKISRTGDNGKKRISSFLTVASTVAALVKKYPPIRVSTTIKPISHRNNSIDQKQNIFKVNCNDWE